MPPSLPFKTLPSSLFKVFLFFILLITASPTKSIPPDYFEWERELSSFIAEGGGLRGVISADTIEALEPALAAQVGEAIRYLTDVREIFNTVGRGGEVVGLQEHPTIPRSIKDPVRAGFFSFLKEVVLELSNKALFQHFLPNVPPDIRAALLRGMSLTKTLETFAHFAEQSFQHIVSQIPIQDLAGKIALYITKKCHDDDQFSIHIREEMAALQALYTAFHAQDFRTRWLALEMRRNRVPSDRAEFLLNILGETMRENIRVLSINELDRTFSPSTSPQFAEIADHARRYVADNLQPIIDRLNGLLTEPGRMALWRNFKGMGGTSTGSIIIEAQITVPDPETAPDVVQHPSVTKRFYETQGPKIFPYYQCSCEEDCCHNHCVLPWENTWWRMKTHMTCGGCCGKCEGAPPHPDKCGVVCACCWYGTGFGLLGEGCSCIGDCSRSCKKCEKCCDPCRMCSKCCGPPYRKDPLRQILAEQVGHRRMSDPALSDRQYTTHNLKENELVYLNETDHPEVSAGEAVEASASAPLYFPAAQITGLQGIFSDGGVGDNGPTFATACRTRKRIQLNYQDRAAPPLEALFLVTFGTGSEKADLSDLRFAGCLPWARKLQKVLKLRVESDHTHLRSMLPAERYYRLQPELTEGLTKMDRPENVPALIRKAKEYRANFPEYRDLLSCLPGGELYIQGLLERVFA